MSLRALCTAAGIAGLAVVVGQMNVGAHPDTRGNVGKDGSGASTRSDKQGAVQGTAVGPDVVVWGLYNYANYGTEGPYRAYAIGTRSCNVGDMSLSWRDSGAFSNKHPVISQNMYRLKDDRLVQIGQAWLKHGFCALDGTQCGTCQGGEGCDWLSVGCSDPYSASLNGNRSFSGPKYEVDAFTGDFPYPPANPSWSGVVARRLRVLSSDVEAASNPGAQWFVESQYVASDDAEWGNADNNVSHREVLLDSAGSISNLVGSTIQFRQALHAWPGAVLVKVDVPNEGRFWLGYKVIDNGDGTWRYEYAVYNNNSDLSAGAFAVPFGSGSNVTGVGFHDVDYHSGEIWDGTDWASSTAAGEVRWETEPFSQNPNANALRWGTQYNFWFVADTPPIMGQISIDLFKPNTPSTLLANALVPDVGGPGPCDGDFNGDTVIDVLDLLDLLAVWGACPGCPQDLNADDVVDVLDLLDLLAGWGPCP